MPFYRAKYFTSLCSFGFLALLFLLSGCFPSSSDPNKLNSINIIDRNGFTETISTPDRLRSFEQMDFLTCMPYEKVLRIYKRNQRGNVRSIITTYHPNGQPKQYLEVVDGRANGFYLEWHENGNQAVEALVIAGEADVIPSSQETWVFDGTTHAWNDDGSLMATICYQKGALEGVSYHYHTNGEVWKKIPYVKNLVHGSYEVFTENTSVLQTMEYYEGLPHGSSFRYWTDQSLAFEECYDQGRLLSGNYYDPKGKLISSVNNGNGYRAVCAKDYVCEYHQVTNGIPEGEIRVLNADGKLIQCYHIKDGVKHGEDIEYFPESGGTKPYISVLWVEGQIQGPVKTWYRDGKLESQKEIHNSKKHGLFTAYYRDGNLMMIEDYDKDKLVKGEYFKIGEKTPISRVKKGNGVATFFDANGGFVNRAVYKNGIPEI